MRVLSRTSRQTGNSLRGGRPATLFSMGLDGLDASPPIPLSLPLLQENLVRMDVFMTAARL